MDLILWRHAEAEELPAANQADYQADLARSLTPRGEKQAAKIAAWLDRQLPEGVRIVSSPARRCEQTVLALGRKYRLRDDLAPGASVAQLIEVAQWPQSKSAVLVVGHQPTLGETLAQLLGLEAGECPVRKGALWWLRQRSRDGQPQTVVVTVQSPEVL
jgi:phosphohistidine phosphatase